MISNDLLSVIANRKKYIDEVSEISTSHGNNTNNNNININKKSIQSKNDYNEKSITNFVGLTNQGATCYLNSLIQSLFMLPEFRIAVYNLSSSIDLELIDNNTLEKQFITLFAYLQLSDKCSISTYELTKSFGWTSQDSFIQQDIQECMTIIFDYFITNCYGSSLANFLNDKWLGEIYDHLICLTCKQSRGSYNIFRDLQLQVKNQLNLENSLHNYILDELIDDIECPHCHSRCTHQKGIKITKLPLIFSLQLKRFDLDWNTYQKIKLNDELIFPIVLDMNNYIDSNDTSYVYDLVSILVHSGSAYAGHYYCYIQDLTTLGKWYLFNDSQVTELTYDQLVIALRYPTNYNESKSPSNHSTKVNVIDAFKNAYMLLYRRRDGKNSSVEDTLQYIPSYLSDLVASDNSIYQINKKEFEYQKAFIHIKVIYNNILQTIKINKDDSIQQLVDCVYDLYFNQLDNKITKDSIHLREFDSIRGVLLGPINKPNNLSDQIKSINEQSLQRVLYIELIDSNFITSESIESLPIELVLYKPSAWIDSFINNTMENFTDPISFFISIDTTIHQLKRLAYDKFRHYFDDQLDLKLGDRVEKEIYDKIDSIIMCTIDIKNGLTIQLSSESDQLVTNSIKAYDRIYIDLSNTFTIQSLTNQFINILEYFDRIYNLRSITLNYIDIHTNKIIESFDIIIDQRQTIYSLKELLSKRLDRTIDSFSIYRTTGGLPSKEIKDLTINLSTLFVEEVLTIGILDDKPLTMNQFRVNIFIYHPNYLYNSMSINQLVDEISVPGLLLTQLVIESNDLICQIKSSDVITKLLQEKQLDKHNRRLRLCTIVNKQSTASSIVSDIQINQSTDNIETVDSSINLTYLTISNIPLTINSIHIISKQVLIDNKSLQNILTNKLSDYCNLLLDIEVNSSIHPYRHVDYTDSDIWLKLILYNQLDDTLSEIVELPVSNTCTYLQLKQLVLTIDIFKSLRSDNQSDNQLDVELLYKHIQITKPFTWQLKEKSNWNQLKWKNQPNLSDQLSAHPWKLKDNCILLLKDSRLDLLDLSIDSTTTNNQSNYQSNPEIGFKLYNKIEQVNRNEIETITNNQRKQLIEDNIKNLINIKNKNNN